MNNQLLDWAYHFFLNTKLSDDGSSIVSTQSEYTYDVASARQSLKFILQDNGISRIPPGCKLPHQHYLNPDFHDLNRERFYVILDKKNLDKHYIEIYLREEGNGFIVGYESVLSNAVEYTAANRASKEFSLFDLAPDGKLYTLAMNYVKANNLDIEQSKNDYERHKKSLEDLFADLFYKN